MRMTLALAVLLSACSSGEAWDPPPAGAELLPVLGSDLRYYALERRREPDGKVRAIVYTQFPQPARNAAGYAGYEVECDDGYRAGGARQYLLRGTGRGTLDETRAGKDAEPQARYPDEGSITREIAVRLCD